MGLGDFWLQFNNGKKEQLKDAKHGVRKEQLDSKFQNLFDAFDVNKDGTLENNELETIANWTKKLSNGDNVLNSNENIQAKSVFSEQINIQDADFQGFVQSLSKASEDIVAVTEKPTPDGGKEIKTEYKDGSVETISYYPDGSYKFKKFDHEYTQNSVWYTINGDPNTHYTESQIDGIIRKDYQKLLQENKKALTEYKKNDLTNRELGKMPPLAPPKYKDYKTLYMERNNICQNTSNNKYEIHNLELSDRAKFDVEVRKFLIEHYVETHQGVKDALDTMGILDDIGAAINTGAGELWNSIVNVYNKWFGDGTQEDYQNFYELVNKFNPHYDKSLLAKGDLEFMTNHPDAFFGSFETDMVENTGHQFNLEKTVQFQNLTQQYQTATIYKQRIDLLKKALSEIDMYWSEQNALVYAPAQNEGLNPASHIVSANNYLLAFFGNDQEAADMVLNGTIGNPDATKTKIKELLQDAQGALDDALLKRTTTLESDGTGSMMMNIATQGMEQYSYDELQAKYQSEYKEMYGVDFVPDELTEKVMGAKATGGMVKIAAITIISIIITRSPMMAEISGAAAGSAEATGAAANAVRQLLSYATKKLGSEAAAKIAVQQGIKLAMTTGTLVNDALLNAFNRITSESKDFTGYGSEVAGSAKYIYFGAYIGSPVAQAVSQRISQIGVAGKLMNGGVKSTKGAIQTTTISGDKLLANISGEAEGVLAKSKAFLKALPAKTGGFAADVGMFTGLEIATEGVDPLTAGAEQGEMLGKLKIMNHFLEYMLGAKTHTAVNKGRWNAAVDRAGVKNWNIKEIKAPSTDGKEVKTTYYVDIDGIPIGKFENADMLTTAMMERVASVYSTIPANENRINEAVPTDETPLTRDGASGNIKTAAGEVIDSENTSNDLMDLSLRNPAQLAEARVREEWQQHDLKANAPETDEPAIILKDGKFVVNEDLAARQLSEQPTSISDEVTSLIFSGKLGQELTRRYEAASDLFNNALQKHKSQIQQFAIEHKDNPQRFAQEVANILSEEFGMKGLEPSVKFVDGSKISGAANFDWSESQIEISDKITDFNQIAELVSHEFNHLLQFADIVAQYGKEGITDLLNQNKSFITASKDLSPEQKAQLVDLYVETEYNQKLVEHVKDKRAEEGSLNDYLRRIYKDELTNPVTSNEPGYTEQVTENEAFFIGNKNGRALGITGKLTEEQFEKLKQENPDIHEGSDGTIFKLNEDGTITKLGIKFPSGETVSEDMGIVRNIIAELRARQDDLFNDIKKGNIVPKEDKIKQLEVLIDKIKQTKNVVKEDDARRTLDDALELAEDMKLNSERIIKANSTLRDFGVVIDFKEVDETTAREIMRAKFPQEIIEERKAYYSSRYNDAESQLESSIKQDIDKAIEACTVNGKISLELIDKYIEIFSKNLHYDWKAKEYVSRFKFQLGIDKNAMEFFDEQTRGAEDYNEAYEKTSKIISTCQNEKGLFDKEYYEKLINFCNGEEADYYANEFISFCKIDGKLNESLYEKGIALKRLGFTNSQVVKLMEECAKKPNERYVSNSKFFKQELYDRIEDMVNQNIDKEQICDFLSHCISEDTRVFDEKAYNMLLEFRKHVDDENTTRAAYCLGTCENVEEACRYVDELRNKYNVSSKQVTYLYQVICDEIKTSDGKKVYRHNPQKYEKAVELLSKYNVEEWVATRIIDDCTLDGKFDIKLYNKFIELKEYGLSDLLEATAYYEKDGDRVLHELFTNAIHDVKDINEHCVDYEILDKLKVWTDIYKDNLKKLNLDKRETEGYWLEFKNDITSIMNAIKAPNSGGIEIVEKFFNLGIKDIGSILKSAYERDENGEINYLKFDKNILNSYLKLAQTHEISEETLLKAIELANPDRYYAKGQPTKYVVSNIAAIDRLLKAGWDKSLSGMNDLLRGQKINDDFNTNIFNQDIVEICEYALKNGVPSKNIFDIIQYCDNNTEHLKNGWGYHRNKFDPANLDRTKFEDLVEIMKYYKENNVSYGSSDYRTCISNFSECLEYKKEILECLQAGKQANVLAHTLNNILSRTRNEQDLILIKEKMPEIIEVIKNNPTEVLDEISERVRQCFFYFDHLEDGEVNKILDACDFYNRNRNRNVDKNEYLENAAKILKELDSDGVSTERLFKYAEFLFKTMNNPRYKGGQEVNVCPEVLAKMKELIQSGELDDLFMENFHLVLANMSIITNYNCAMYCSNFFAYDNPKLVGVLDALVKAKKDGLFDNKIMQKFVLEHLEDNSCEDGFYSNYQSIIDFYKENKDFILSFDLENDHEAYEKLRPVFEYRTMKPETKYDENGNQIKPETSQEDVQTLNKIVKYMKLLENKSVFTNIMQYVDLKDVVNFLDKVDMDKYSDEVNDLMNQLYSSSYNSFKEIFNSSLTEREINFIFDIQQLHNKTINEHNAEVDATGNGNKWGYEWQGKYRTLLNNDFFEIFTNGHVSDEAMNKLRFYIESNLSIPENKGAIGNIGELKAVINVYKNRPDKINETEHYLFDETNQYKRRKHIEILQSISVDREIADIEWTLLDDAMSYKNTKEEEYAIQNIFRKSDSIETVQAKLNVWNAMKPTDKNVSVETLNAIFSTIGSIVPYKQNIIIDAYKAGYNSNDLKLLSNYIKEATTEKIHDLIKQNYPIEFVIKVAANSRTSIHVEYGVRMFQEQRYEDNEISSLINPVTEETRDLADLVYFNKDEVFSADIAREIIQSAQNENQKLIGFKLVKDKTFPRDRMAEAMTNYCNDSINPDLYINKYKMFIKLGFDKYEIASIIGSSSSLAYYTENICQVLFNLKEKGANPRSAIEFLLSDRVSDNITDNIKVLEILNLLEDKDYQLLAKDGIDITSRIQKLQKAIDVKHPIVETQKQDAIAFLKVLANNSQADDRIRTMDLSSLEKGGVPLQYSREEFIQRMNNLIAQYMTSSELSSSIDSNSPKIDIPKLQLSESAEAKVQAKIEEFKQQYAASSKEVDINIDGTVYKGTEFEGSKQNGSNPANFYLIDGKLYYVKKPTSDKLGQSVEEVIASQLYRAAGIDAPNEHYVFDEKGNVIGMASEYIPDMQARNWGSASEGETKLMFESFAADAWLANWDAPKNDNTQIYDNGKIIKSDVGGSMRYRARGDVKDNFNSQVTELITLIEQNPFYNKMTKQDVLHSIQKVLDISDETIIQIIMSSPTPDMKLAEKMLKRKEYMQKFAENLQTIDDTGLTIMDVLIEAQAKTMPEFRETPDIAGAFGYIPTQNGFEGLLNTQKPTLVLNDHEARIAEQMRQEIERFTVGNRIADNAPISEEVRTFLNGVLKGVPEFASYFGKAQHGNGNVDANGRQLGGHQYPLDIHILKVLQKSVNNPLYDAKDEFGNKLLDDESKIVLKFATLLHDIGKRTLNGKDAGHAELSAQYVYSILDRFNLPTRVKDRIIKVVDNHHWFEAYCTKALNEEGVAAIFRTNADFTIARIMAQADLESVYDGYFTTRMQKNFPSEVRDTESAQRKFDAIMETIESRVNHIESLAPVIQPSKFVETMGVVDGVYQRRGFPKVMIELDGKQEEFKILNLNDLDPDTDMFQYGFNHIKLKDLRLLVHRFGDSEVAKLKTFQLLGNNPQNISLQSLSLISTNDVSAYCGQKYAIVVDGNMDNIGVAYNSNANTGGWKSQLELVEEIFGSSFAAGNKNYGKYKDKNVPNHSSYRTQDAKYRTFFHNEFVKYMKDEKGVDIDDKTYTAIIRYVHQKQYIETQIKDVKIGNTVIKAQDLVDGLFYARDMLIEKVQQKHHGSHDEVTQIDCKVVAGGASVEQKTETIMSYGNTYKSFLREDFLRSCRDNCDRRIILW